MFQHIAKFLHCNTLNKKNVARETPTPRSIRIIRMHSYIRIAKGRVKRGRI